MEDQTPLNNQNSQPNPDLPTKESLPESGAIAQPVSSVPTPEPSLSPRGSTKCECATNVEMAELNPGKLTINELDLLDARLKRLEEIAELLYWTKEKTVTTPHSAGLAHKLDMIFKYKTV